MNFLERLNEAIGKALLAQLRESKAAQTGIYWWLPTEDGKWHLATFPEEIFGEVTHDQIWEKYVLTSLFPGQRPTGLQDAYAGLPRGRVAQPIKRALGAMHQYAIYHGDDTPVKGGLEKVRRAFNLPKDGTRAVFDDHERTLPSDARLIKRAIQTAKMAKSLTNARS